MLSSLSSRFFSSRSFNLAKRTINVSVRMTRDMHTAKSSNIVDLRSDTLTRPCEGMRKAMAEAIVGDDVYFEDPTVNRLQDRCASLFGKEDALFVCSGTMANLLAIIAHCDRGDEIIVGDDSHIHKWEQGNYASVAGISANTVSINEFGELPLDEIRSAIRVKDDCHVPNTKLICLESTHNFAGGKPLSLEYIKEVRKIADEDDLLVHIDGARFYHSAIAQGRTVAELAAPVDSLMMCFSKGLGAPIGSVLLGTKDFIEECRLRRKALGGGWRQAGVLAAAAEFGLERAEETIREDHRRAKRLARGINDAVPESKRGSLRAEDDNITNFVMVHTGNDLNPTKVTEVLQSHGVLGLAFDTNRVRLVVHRCIDDDGIEKTIDAFKQLALSI